MANNYKYIDNKIITEVDDIESICPGINMVLVRPELDTSLIGDCNIIRDTYFEEIECASREVRVIKIPPYLAIKGCFHYKDHHHTALDWCTSIKLRVGDLAWVDPLFVLNNNNTNDTHVYSCDGILYYAIRYDKFIASKRGDKKIMLNGYVIYENIYENSSGIIKDALPKTKYSKVLYTGVPNSSYFNEFYSDDYDVEVGDIMLNPKHMIPLEGHFYKNFDKGKRLYIVQRRGIKLIFKDMNLKESTLPPGKLLVSKIFKEEKTNSGIILPDKAREEEKTGTVIKMNGFKNGYELEGLGVGSKVSFSRHRGSIEIEGKSYLYMDAEDVITYTKVK